MNELSSLQHVSAAPLVIMMQRAADRLLEARTSADVLEAKKLADLAFHYAKVTHAANETHGDCLRIITRAEIRMADEVDRARDAGEIAHRGQRANVRSPDISDLGDLGLSKQRLSEWRDLRDAGGEEVVERAIDQALSEGRAPTKSDIVAHARGTFGTGDNEWFTPAKYIDAARTVMGNIELDPASNPIAQKTVRAGRFYTREDDGLAKVWDSPSVWLNPPYAQPLISQFVSKLANEVAAGRTAQAIMLTHNYTDTQWFHEAERQATLICFTRGRVKFVDPDGKEAAPTQGQAFFYFGPSSDDFRSIFGSFGFVR